MLGKCFGIISCASIIYAIVTGRMSEISSAIIASIGKSTSLVISLIGAMAFWNGILKVFVDCGIIKKLSKILRPILRHVFPKSFKDDVATEEITACISANLLGISNAATPLAITAIEKMDKSRKNSKFASKDMITLAILGCSCFNFLPTTVLALRSAFSAELTYELIVPIWICSGACMILGILLSKAFGIACGCD
jgi:spore maturation protein A